jgi:hypothetical protein
MGVFLRWGIFGIIAVAALVYAYNALGHLADRRKAAPAAVVAPPSARDSENTPPLARVSENTQPPAPTSAPTAQRDALPERCRIELAIAQRAIEARSIGEPLDRLLRIQEIAWQEDAKLREQFTKLATRWYNEPGPVDAARLRRDVVTGCIEFKQ